MYTTIYPNKQNNNNIIDYDVSVALNEIKRPHAVAMVFEVGIEMYCYRYLPTYVSPV